MKANRRSLKIKPGVSVVDVKLKGRVDKAQSFAKAVFFSLFLLILVGIYMRWDALMDLKHLRNDNQVLTEKDKQIVDESLKNGMVNDMSAEPSENKNSNTKYAKELAHIKSILQQENKLSQDPVDSKNSQTLAFPTEVKKGIETYSYPKSTAESPNSSIVDKRKSNIPKLRGKFNVVEEKLSLNFNSQFTAVSEINLLADASVTASVEGNLGSPSVVISPAVEDWLKDRWQAAKDLTGAPIPGPHWLQFDLPRIAVSLSRILIDYEVALSNDYSIDLYCIAESKWKTVHDTRVADAILTKATRKDKRHIIHDIKINDASCDSFSKLKILIRRPATRFGTSIWLVEAYGRYK